MSVEKTPSCECKRDCANPVSLTFEDITAAYYSIRSGIIETPAAPTHLGDILGMQIYLKDEFFQYTGSFKERGARYCLLKLTPEQKHKGVVSASPGNHALGLSYHGMKLGIPVTVVCPVTTPLMKIHKCKKFGATVVTHGKNFDEAEEYAERLAAEKDLYYISGFDHPDIIAGHGTIGLEICRDVPSFDAVLVGVGGGALIAGVALAIKTLKPDVEIIGVESEKCSGFSESLKIGHPLRVNSKPSLADGLEVPLVGCNALAIAKPYVDKMVTVSEDYIALAILRLVEIEKAVIEGAGAICIAALLQGLLPHLRGKRIVCVIGGGNIDTIILGRCLDRGLAADGRLMRVSVIVLDRPGGVSDFMKMLVDNGGCVKDSFHERAWVRGNVFGVKLTVVVETRDKEHSRSILDKLRKVYKKVSCTIETTAVERSHENRG